MYMPEPYLDSLIEEWKSKSPHPLEGCTQNELIEIMDAQHVTWLPSIYQTFMSHLGRTSGGIEKLYGDEFRYPYVLSFKEKAIPLLVQQLPTDCFIFWTNYENVLFFHTLAQTDDPSIYHMTSEDDFAHKLVITKKDDLSQFLYGVIESNLALL